MEGVNNTLNSSGSGGEVLGGGDTNMKSADNIAMTIYSTKISYINHQTLR